MFLSCDSLENDLVINENLPRSKWQLEGFKMPYETELISSHRRYVLEFLNDSVYTLNLDVNQVFGKYESGENGNFRLWNMEQTIVCCDSEYALNFLELLKGSGQFRTTGKELVINGEGEMCFLREN